MSRIARKYLDSSYYHVMTQGINREFIFQEDSMKKKYKELIFQKSHINRIYVIAYCIMDNHTHLLVKSPESSNLSKMMLQINSSFGKFYNKRKRRVGYVFRDRYRTEPIFTQNQLINCIKYIHENPKKAQIVLECEKYEYSSYNDYLNNKISKEIIEAVYGNCVDYMSKISGNYEDYNFIEISNEFGSNIIENFETVCKEYKKIDFKDENNVYKISRELKNRCNVTDKKIISFMGLKRATYYNILKRQKNLDF